MGMAASQARLLGLGSKKTNAEWQGQQINQARTALSNQTADLWNKLLNMKVPNAPKVTDYTTPSYSFSDGQTDYEVNSIDSGSDKTGYNSKVTYTYYRDGVQGVESVNKSPQVQKSVSSDSDGKTTVKKLPSGSYLVTINGTSQIVSDLTNITDPDLKEALVDAGIIKDVNQNVSTYQDPTTKETKYLVGDLPVNDNDETDLAQYSSAYKVGTSPAQVADLTDTTVKAALEKIAEDFPNSDIATAINSGESIYTYSKNGTINYACMKDLEKAIASSSGIDNQSEMKQYIANAYKEAVTRTDDAIVEYDSSGRCTSVALSKYSDVPFSLHSESTTDMTAYDAAIKSYTSEKEQYEQTLEEINAKTKKIQEQDRTLELRLKNLDTEREALQNEMATVKKIMEKKVDEVFKTYQ